MATVEDYLNDPETAEAERDLIEACRKGMACRLGDLPPETGDAPTVRAELIRCLALEASSLHEAGVWLEGARITGTLDLSFAKCRGMLLLNKCRFEQSLILIQAEVGLLSLDHSHFPGLFAPGANLAGGMLLRHVQATAPVDISGAQIGVQLDCSGATLNGNEWIALKAQGLRVTGNVFFRDLQAVGTVDVNGARIEGQLACENAKLNGNIGDALNAQGVRVTDAVFLNNLTATGLVSLRGAQIGGQLSCTGAMLDGNGARALNAQGVRVMEAVFLTNMTAIGTVALGGAQIGGQLSCTGATLDGNGDKALNAQGVQVQDAVFLRSLRATGTVDLSGAQIGGQLVFQGAILNGNGGDAFNGQFLQVKEAFIFLEVKSVTGRVDLASAHVGDLVDDSASWATCDALVLAGFTYDSISGGAPNTFELRKEWLAKGARPKSEFFPQPYTQFAKVMRASGLVGEARKTLMERERLIAEYARKNMPNKAMKLFFTVKDFLHRFSLGYGYAIHRAMLFSLIVFVPIAALGFHYAYAEGAMVPNSDVILTSPSWLWALMTGGETPTLVWADGAVARHYETFYALPYAFDVFVPLVDLGQQSAWSATTVTWTGWFARMGTMLLEVMGWFAGTLAAVSVTGLLQRNDPE